MYFYFLVGPMILGAQGDVVAVFHAAKGGRYIMLTAIAPHLYVAPKLIVCKEDRLSEHRFLRLLACPGVETTGETRQTCRSADLNLKQLLHVAGPEPTPNLPGCTLHRGWTNLAKFSMTPELTEQLLAFDDLSEESSGFGHKEILVVSNQDGTMYFESLSLETVHPRFGQPLFVKRSTQWQESSAVRDPERALKSQ